VRLNLRRGEDDGIQAFDCHNAVTCCTLYEIFVLILSRTIDWCTDETSVDLIS
jgi:hypothetical protein